MLQEPIEKMIGDMSSFLSSSLSSLGINWHAEEREDLLQEIRIRIWKAYRRKDGNIQFINAYIKKIVYSVFVNEIKRIKKENRVLESGRIGLITAPDVENENFDTSEKLKCTLAVALGSLRGEQQQVIKLRLEGFSIFEIAQLKGWSYRKTCNTIYRGIKKMKEKLREEGYCYED